MSNVFSVCNMTHINEIRLVWLTTRKSLLEVDIIYTDTHTLHVFFSASEVGILLNYVSIGLYNIYTYQTLTVYHVESFR